MDGNSSDAYSGDIIAESHNYLIIAIFAKTNSYSYPLALNVAQQAEKYEEFVVGKTITHIAGFAKTKAGAEQAALLVRYINGWKGSTVIARGRTLHNYYGGAYILQCYLQGLSCNDRRAHCYKIIDSPYGVLSADGTVLPRYIGQDKTKYILPCQLLDDEYSNLNYHPCHPSDIKDLIQASAIAREVDICPLFDLDAFKSVGE